MRREVLRVYTAAVSYLGADRVDIRPGTQDDTGRLFELPADLAGCGARLRSEETWDARREAYVDALRRSYARDRAAWLALRTRGELTFVCGCGERGWCLARTAADILCRALPGLSEHVGPRQVQRELGLGGGSR